MPAKLNVLFLCTGNSCRSQMAEGWARAIHGARLNPYSAGTHPGSLDPRAVLVMREAGVDISGQRAKPLEALKDIEFDGVVTVCDRANENCPVFPGTMKRLHRDFDDPPQLAANAASDLEALGPYRRVRDEIRAYVATLPESLTAPN